METKEPHAVFVQADIASVRQALEQEQKRARDAEAATDALRTERNEAHASELAAKHQLDFAKGSVEALEVEMARLRDNMREESDRAKAAADSLRKQLECAFVF
jgi:septal ring factor EnvC (AmiA/AmiB activator)